MARHADKDWNLNEAITFDDVKCALLMDIRGLLRTIRDQTYPLHVLTCHNTRDIPRLLRKIAANTDKYKCRAHPRYQGLRPPKADCIDCRRVFRRRRA